MKLQDGAGWWVCDSREHGRGGRVPWRRRCPGPRFGRQIPSRSNSWSKRSMMSFLYRQISTSGAGMAHQHGSLEHILSSCTTALGEGRYCCWYNQVQSPSSKLWPTISTAATGGTSPLSGPVSSHIHSPSRQLGCSPRLRTGSFKLIWGSSLSSRSTSWQLH